MLAYMENIKNKQLVVLGIRGVPATHGGFETFAESLCPFLVSSGWKVTVYCQEEGSGSIYASRWGGVDRIHIPVKNLGPLGTIIFDFRSVLHSLRFNGVFLTLGYNTAIFNLLHRAFGKKNIINMDGIEWKRQKWSAAAKAWFWFNERLGCWFGNHLIADHPKIKEHLATRVSQDKITMIPYGAKEVLSADESVLSEYGLIKDNYAIVIARAEPENSILEAVQAFSRVKRNVKLVVLGNYTPEETPYHQAVLDAACDEVLFVGAIYDVEKVAALRFFARFYVHGHQVGGTNPSLVEALGVGSAVLAHDNAFNRWVVNDGAVYFSDVDSAALEMTRLFECDQYLGLLKARSREIFKNSFKWGDILSQYEQLLDKYVAK